MAVIFVHGVNNRMEDPDYEAQRNIIAGFLKRYLAGVRINGKSLAIFDPAFPYWGNLGVSFAWQMQSLPSGEMDALGSAVDPALRPLVSYLHDALPDPKTAVDEPLVALARQSFPRAIDLLSEVVTQTAPPNDAAMVGRFVVEAQIYASRFEPPRPPPNWLAAVSTDQQFCSQLLCEISQSTTDEQALGGAFGAIGNRIAAGVVQLKMATQAAARTVLDRTGNFASTEILGWSRQSLNANLGRFFGDIFVYMDERGTREAPGRIPTFLLSEWDKAIAATPGEPLIIMGHSLGGVISYDLLTHFRPELQVDLFVSVGSQVSHFEEMKRFRCSRPDIPGAGGPRVPKWPNIKHWINVYDVVDIFSYSCKSIFDSVDDFYYDTKTYVIKSHGAYLKQARYYERLRDRINKLPAV
jgi:hypothetical protein